MENLQIISQLLEGNHLEPNELEQAQTLVTRLQKEIDNRLNIKNSSLTITFSEQQTVLDLLHHHRRTTDKNKDVYAHNKQALLVRLNNNKYR